MQTKKKTARRSLAVSAVALLLSVAMLVGTTFAWFTDTVTSGTNTITAGNLDIEVSYKNDTTNTWTPMEGDSSLFSSNLWEPGHTEFVTLKIENKGTLALNYKVLVTPVSEKGGVNVDGNSFKLSDYLVVKTIKNTVDPNYRSRTEARSAAGEVKGLAEVNTLTQTGTMVGKDTEGYAEQYVTLVVYMPEDVDNKANYKTGTEPPSIDLGIKVLATQKTEEHDSFGNNYDEEAVNDSFYKVGAYYDYYPQVRASEAVVADDNTVITATGKLKSNDDNVITLAKVTVPHAAVAADATTLTVTVVPKAPAQSTTDKPGLSAEIQNSNRETANFDIKVEGVASTNDEDITVEVFVGKGLSNVKVYHNGDEIDGTVYNADTGIVTFKTKTFSDYTVAYDVAAAAIGSKTYGSLQLAINAAQTGETITILKDTTENGQIVFPGDKTLTVDLNGKNITAVGDNSGFWAKIDGNVTFKGDGYVGDKTHESVGYLFYLTGTLSIEGNATYECGLTVVQLSSDNAELYIKGGSYIGGQWNNVYWTINKIDKYRNTAKAEIAGGRFYEFDPSNGHTENPADNFVAIGYDVKENGDWFEVVEKVYDFSCGAKTELNTKIPDDATIITTQAQLEQALADAQSVGTNTLYVGAGEFKINNNVNCDGKTIVFVGAGFDKTKLIYGSQPGNPKGEGGSCFSYEGSTVTFKDATLSDVNGDDVDYKGFVRCAGLTFENCVLKSRMTYLGENGVVSFEHCTFETPKYAAWIYNSQTYNFSNCLFNSPTGRFLNVHSESNITPTIKATECKFIDSSNGTDSKAVFNIKEKAKTTLIIKDCVVTGASPMYNVQTENGTVVNIDGKIVYGTTVN